MDTFLFKPALEGRLLQICQSSTGAIGSKIYPGALKLCSFLPNANGNEEEKATPKELDEEVEKDSTSSTSILTKVLAELIYKDCLVLELGAGVCALPTLQLALAKRQVIATDLPEMLPLLGSNLESNFPSLPRLASTFPLAWGVESDVAALRSSLTRFPDVILGADVVYHDHLIEPLLSTLKWLTNGDDTTGRDPPVIVISYVQRFKKAKRFLKLARKSFDVTIYSTGHVVDYDVLTWSLPKVVAMSKGEGVPGETEQPMIFTPQSAEYNKFIDALTLIDHKSLSEQEHEVSASFRDSIKTGEKSSSSEKGEIVSNPSHHIDSDSGDEWEDNDGYKRRMLNTTVSGIMDNHGHRKFLDHDDPQSMSRDQKAQYAASKLGFCIHDPLESFVWILKRKTPHS